MRRLCIIPAFDGSDVFFDRNLAKLAGKSLIRLAVEQAAPYFDKVIFSSDSERYLDEIEDLKIENVVCSIKKYGSVTDETTLDETASHYFKQYKKHFIQMWMLLPTCPLRDNGDIEDAQKILDDSLEGVDGVVSVTRMEYCPYFCLQIEDNLLYDWHESKPRDNNSIMDRTHYRKVYKPNGAIYGRWMKSFEMKPRWLRGRVEAHVMSRDRSINIQTKHDLRKAELSLRENKC